MTSRSKPSAALTSAKILARAPSLSVPVVCSLAPESWSASGTLNMSTMVVLQYIPPEL